MASRRACSVSRRACGVLGYGMEPELDQARASQVLVRSAKMNGVVETIPPRKAKVGLYA